MNNKKGVKLLTMIMALAVVLAAGFIVVSGSDESDAVTDVKSLDSDNIIDDAANANYFIPATVSNIILNNSTGTPVITLYVMNGANLTITGANGNTSSLDIYAITVAPTEQEIAAGNISTLHVTHAALNDASILISVKATTSNSVTDAMITGPSSGLTPAGHAITVTGVSEGKISYISEGYNATISGPGSSTGTVTATFATGTAADHTSVIFKNGNNRIDLKDVEAKEAFTVTMTGGTIEFDSASISSYTIGGGEIEVVSGQVVFGDTAGIKLGGTTAPVMKYVEVGTLTADKTYTSADVLKSDLIDGTYDKNIKVRGVSVSAELVKLNGAYTISFLDNSTFAGKIVGMADATTDGASLTISVSGDNASRSVQIRNGSGANSGKLALTTVNTAITVESTPVVVGSELVVREFDFNGKDITVSSDANTKAIALGTMVVNTTITMGHTTIVPQGEIVTFATGGLILTNNLIMLGDLKGVTPSSGSGMIAKTDATTNLDSAIVATQKGKVAVDAYAKTTGAVITTQSVTTLVNAQIASDAGFAVNLNLTTTTKYSTTTGNTIATGAKAVDLTFTRADITITGADPTIVTGSKVTFQDETVFKSVTQTLKLEAGSEIVIKDSNILMQVDKNALADVKVSAKTSVYTNPTGSIAVGYMREATLDGDINGSTADVFGKLIISSKTKLSSGSVLNVYQGGQLVVDGDLTVEGTVNFKTGSQGTVNGTISIGSSSGGAEMNVNTAAVTINEEGTVKVNTVNRDVIVKNKLTVTGADRDTYDSSGMVSTSGKEFVVYGTLDVKGIIDANRIEDRGNITISGYSENTTIYVYDGITLNASAVDGTLTVSDDGIMNDAVRTRVSVADGNSITLNNITGVNITVSTAENSYTKTVDSVTSSYKVISTIMDVSGNFGEVVKDDGGSVSITNSASKNSDGKGYGKVTVTGDINLGERVGLTIGASAVSVTGNINASAKNCYITVTGAADVTGSVVVKTGTGFSTGITGYSKLSAAAYAVTDLTNNITTYTYTDFVSAISAAPTANDKKVDVYGNVSASKDVEILAGTVVDIHVKLTVKDKATVIVKTGADVTGDTISVSGTFTSEDYANDLDVDTIKGDVVSTSGTSKTWTGIVNALALAKSGDVITTSNAVTITDSVSIPEGVTVQSEYSVIVKQNTILTIDGTLNIIKGTITDRDSNYDESVDVPGKVIVSDTGVASVVKADSAAVEPTILADVSGAHFVKIVGAKYFDFVTNIDYAAANIDAKVQNNQTVTLKGTIEFDEVTFSATEGVTVVNIVIADIGTASDDKKTVVVGDLKLVSAKLTLNTGIIYTGDVTAASNGSDAVISFESAEGIVVETYRDSATTTPVDYMFVYDKKNGSDFIAEGTMTISSGEVYVSKDNAGVIAGAGLITDEDFTVIVDNGAKLNVPNNSSITVKKSEKADKATFIVKGDLEVKKGAVTVYGTNATASTYGIMDVLGTVNVSESSNTYGITVNGILNVLGTVNVSGEDGKEGRLVVNEIMTVGAKPTTLGADATVNGTVTIGSACETVGYVKVYSGDVESIIENAQDAKSTVITINDVEYMTVYGKGDVRALLAADDIDLNGIDGFVNGTKIYSDREMMKEITTSFNIGDYDAIYFKLETSTADVYVSVGTHLTLWIDGEKYISNASAPYKIGVGIHQVKIVIDAGYQGDTVITFNGQIVTNGQFTITTAMLNEKNTISATGDLTVIPVEEPEKDSGMGITDYLLIVLVILAAILVVVVAIRMMRS